MYDIIGHYLNNVFKRSVFLSGLAKTGNGVNQKYWALGFMYLSSFNSSENSMEPLLQTHNILSMTCRPRLFQKGNVVLTLDIQGSLEELPIISHINIPMAKSMKFIQNGIKWVCLIHMKSICKPFWDLLHFWIVNKILWPELSPFYRLENWFKRAK